MGKLKVATIGFGGRGRSITNGFLHHSDEAEFVACVEPVDEVRNKCIEDFGISEDMAFTNYDDFFAKGLIADILIIATMDVLHHDPVMKAMELGYKNIILEKPIALSLEECKDVVYTAEKLGVNMAICHVLRYDPFFRRLKEVIDSGVIGEVKTIHHIEGAGFMNYVHSFVRGHMSNTEISAPFVIQKTCHDFDLFVFLTGKKFKRVSSFGSLSWFKEENAPKGAGTRCVVDCKCKDECIYDAERMYGNDKGSYISAILREGGYADLDTCLRTTDYGRCVYRCNNDVCDNQVVNIEFDDNTTGSLTISGFDSGRRMSISGVKGRIEAHLHKMIIMVEEHATGKVTEINVRAEMGDALNHSKQDVLMARSFLDVIKNNAPAVSSVLDSLESHLGCFAAEMSRLEGRMIDIDSLR